MGVIVGVRRRQYSLVWHMDYGTIGWLYRSGSVSYSATQRAPNDWWGLAGRATQRAPKDCMVGVRTGRATQRAPKG